MKAWLKGCLKGFLIGIFISLITLLAIVLFYKNQLNTDFELMFYGSVAIIFTMLSVLIGTLIELFLENKKRVKNNQQKIKLPPWLKGGFIAGVIALIFTIGVLAYFVSTCSGEECIVFIIVPFIIVIVPIMWFVSGAIGTFIIDKIIKSNKSSSKKGLLIGLVIGIVFTLLAPRLGLELLEGFLWMGLVGLGITFIGWFIGFLVQIRRRK